MVGSKKFSEFLFRPIHPVCFFVTQHPPLHFIIVVVVLSIRVTEILIPKWNYTKVFETVFRRYLKVLWVLGTLFFRIESSQHFLSLLLKLQFHQLGQHRRVIGCFSLGFLFLYFFIYLLLRLYLLKFLNWLISLNTWFRLWFRSILNLDLLLHHTLGCRHLRFSWRLLAPHLRLFWLEVIKSNMISSLF